MDLQEKDLSGASDEDFANLSSSEESSDEEVSEESSEDESEDSPQDARKKKKGKPVKKVVPKKKKAPKVRIIMNVSDTQYDVVKYVGKKLFGWKLTYETENWDWDMFWTDNAVQPETLAKMQTYQKINHFPGMYSLARKNHLGRNLMRMKKAFPEQYKFFPQTFLLPTEYNEFKLQFNKKKNKTFIVKPEASCQGRGIFLTRTWESVQVGEHYVAQRYLHKPFLIDGLKFDMRVYVLLAGCDPLKIFIYDDGLARFCTEAYVAPTGENLDNICMHLTNYAINKDNPNFVFNESSSADDVGHKRSLKATFRLMAEMGHDVDAIWKEIRRIVIKTFCSVQPILGHSYRSCHPDEPYNNMCFEILGFDVMLDHKLQPWLIEVNHTPSFTTDTPLDKSIKKGAIRDALKIMNISVENKIKAKNKKRAELQARVLTGKKVKISPEEKQAAFEKAQKERDVWEAKNCGRYTKIFPFDDPAEAEEDYDGFMREANNWWEQWTGTSIKRNVKKTADPNKPPPFVFGGNANNLINRTKDIQSIYSQKLKIPGQKPPSVQGPRLNAQAANQGGDPNQTPSKTNAAAATSSAKAEIKNWEENEAALENKYLDEENEENEDFMQHVRAITGREPVNVVAEDQPDEDYNNLQQNHYARRISEANKLLVNAPSKIRSGELTENRREKEREEQEHEPTSNPNIDGKISGNRGTFRIKTLHTMKESPSKIMSEKEPEGDNIKYMFSRKFAHYIKDNSKEEDMSNAGVNVTPGSISKQKSIVERDYEREMQMRKIPMKLSNGIIGTFGMANEMMSLGANGVQVVPGMDMDRDNRLGNQYFSNRKDPNAKFGQKKTMPPSYVNKGPGNFLAPKVYQLDIQTNIKEDVPVKGTSNERIGGGGLSLQGFGVVNTGSGKPQRKGPLIPREANNPSNINYFQDSNASLQRYYNFLAHAKK